MIFCCNTLITISNIIFPIFVSVKVKWGRENFPNVGVNTDENPVVFKTQLFTLTGVQVHRQKVMCKGVALKDDEWNFQLKDVCISAQFYKFKFNCFKKISYVEQIWFLYRALWYCYSVQKMTLMSSQLNVQSLLKTWTNQN